MASNIQIKRSGTTAVPVELLPGELAYSWASGGDKLYIGAKGTDGFGFANEVTVIGGEYFTAKLDHTPGILTANSAIITDATNKIDVINIDNITIDGNTISSTNINGNIIIDTNGTGDIDVSNARIINLATPTANTDAVTKAYVDISISDLNFATNFDFTGDTGSDSLFLATETLAFIGGTGISTAVANNSITFDLENTGVVANTYGSSTEVPILTIDAQGRITLANTASISTDLLMAGDTGTGSVSLLDETLTVAGGTGISTSVANNTITINGDDATTTTKGIASFSTDNFTVTSGAVVAKSATLGTSTITLGSTTSTIAGLQQLDVDNIRVDGNTISSTNTDGSIILNPNGAGIVDVSSSRITGVATPTAASDAANKEYVDELVQGLKTRTAANAYSDSNLPATYDNGTLGVGATLTSTTNGVFPVIDGVTLDPINIRRLLVAGQTNPAHNGLYVLIDAGSASTPWVLRRCSECDTAEEIPGSYVFVSGGSGTYSNTGWVATVADQSTFTVGTDAITWVQFSGAGAYIGGDGLTLTGNIFSVNVDDSSIEIVTDILRVKAAGITNAMLAGSIENSKLVNSSITFAAETGTSDPVSLGETITFAAGEGIDTVVSNNTITISGEDASDTNKGIASFVNTDFIVSSGSVSINDQKLFDTIGATVVAGQAITVTYAANTVTVAANTATTTTLGVASFSADNFTVSSGAVSIAAIDGGTF